MTPLTQRTLEAAQLEIEQLQAEVDTLRTAFKYLKQVHTLPEFIDLHYKRRREFCEAIGTTEQWVSEMGANGYIVVNGVPYSLRKKLADKMAKLNLEGKS